MRVDWRDRVEIHDDLHHGDPCIRGTRIPVRTIIGSLADGMSLDEIREAYPSPRKMSMQRSPTQQRYSRMKC